MKYFNAKKLKPNKRYNIIISGRDYGKTYTLRRQLWQRKQDTGM